MHRLTTIPLCLLLATLGCDAAQPDDESARLDDVPECGPETFPCDDGDGDGDGSVDTADGAEDDDGSAEDEGGSSDDACDDDDHGSDDDADEEEESDLPYNWELDLGDTVVLEDAFLLEGPAPAEIVEVTMEDGDWRLDELVSGTPFEVTEEDCDHEGNKDVGKDRIEITWINPDGSEDTDHMTLRYCGA